jgi:uncharacterized protein (DUF608 family)
MANDQSSLDRRDFLKLGAATSVVGLAAASTTQIANAADAASTRATSDGKYDGQFLSRVAFPLGGLGAGMVCLEGTGALSHFSVRNRPDVFNEPCIFAALSIKGPQPLARVLEGPVPSWKLFGGRGDGEGAVGATYGLPRFARARFATRFPFGTVDLDDDALPVKVQLTGWSPFTPGDVDSSALPFAALEYRITNTSSQPLDAIFSFNAKNVMEIEGSQRRAALASPGGFKFFGAGPADRPWDEGYLSVSTSDPDVQVNHAWLRGGWWDAFTIAWRDIENATMTARPPITEGEPAPGASLFVPVKLAPNANKTIPIRLCWYVPVTNLHFGEYPEGSTPPAVKPTHRPWYAAKFPNIDTVETEWSRRYGELRERAEVFAKCFYDSTLPDIVVEAIAANLAILKSPTILRQHDGKMWAYEGCGDIEGRGDGTCTHVWNYAQAIAHLFPAFERTLRDTEFNAAQDERGHQMFRISLPIRPIRHHVVAAADGQLGGILKLYRDWRISADTQWLRGLWPRARASLDYCIATWDPRKRGWLEEPHHNTYDTELWGPNGMCSSIYLGALQAATIMGRALRENVSEYAALYRRGRTRVEADLFDGEYFAQKIEWHDRGSTLPPDRRFKVGYSPEAAELADREGPKYQYGPGCLSDGVIGDWFARVCGVGDVLDKNKVASHLRSVHKYNLKQDLFTHANTQRPGYAAGHESGLLLCSWPKGGRVSLPFPYSNEVWTGIEYQVASHLIMSGDTERGLDIIKACRSRYDGRVRNPFDEYEYGHWYARALASYSLLQAFSGARYDAIDKVLYLEPTIRGDFRCFLSTATGFGTAGVRGGEPFFDVVSGKVDVKRIEYRAVA